MTPCNTAQHFSKWAKNLRLDNGRPLTLQKFQLEFVTDLFAGYRECWFVVPEGNGKTTLLAALVLYHAAHVDEAFVPVAAATRDQAMILYRQARGFVIRSELEGFKLLDGYRRIRHPSSLGEIQIFAADEKHGDGVIPTLCVLDEPHRQDNMNLYRTWSGKLDKREGQLAAISTAGEPGSEFEETRTRIRQEAIKSAREGCHLRCEGDGIVLHEWALPEGSDSNDLRLVKQANPHRGITLGSLKAKRSRPTMTEGHWRRFTCNMPTRTIAPAISEAEWREAQAEGWQHGQPVWAGLDVGWRYDATALVPLQMGDIALLGEAAILYPPLDSQLELEQIVNAIVELHARNPIEALVMDISDARDVQRVCEDELGLTVIERPVTLPAQVNDYNRFMEGLRGGLLKHTGDPGLTRHVLNASVKELPRGDAVFSRPYASRTVSSAQRLQRSIDALVASAMVYAVALEGGIGSVYDERGLLAV